MPTRMSKLVVVLLQDDIQGRGTKLKTPLMISAPLLLRAAHGLNSMPHICASRRPSFALGPCGHLQRFSLIMYCTAPPQSCKVVGGSGGASHYMKGRSCLLNLSVGPRFLELVHKVTHVKRCTMSQFLRTDRRTTVDRHKHIRHPEGSPGRN